METAINKLTVKNNAWTALLAIADHEAAHKTIWYLFSLIFQGVVFLPIPAVLMYYYHASIIVLPVTFIFYLANIIIGMGGYSVRVIIGSFILSMIVNLSMLAFYIL